MDPDTLIRKLISGRGRDVLGWRRRFTYFVLGYRNGEPPRHAPEHGDYGVFFSSTFFSLIPERLDAARAFGSLAFFMRTKARRDRVMYSRRSTRFARVYLHLYKVFAFYFGHTLETLFSQTQHLNICMGHSGTKSNSSGLPMRTLHCSLNPSGA